MTLQELVESLRLFVEQNRTDIFAFVENSRRQIEQDYENRIFRRLINELVIRFPVCHCDNGPIPGHAEFDKVHYEFAVAILQVFWCGCLPQMKENRMAYSVGTTDTFRSILLNTFDIARQYAPIEEERRTRLHD